MRYLHTMFRVTDLVRSVEFYTQVLEMTLISQKDYPQGEFTLAFLGYGTEQQSTLLELTHNWDNRDYQMGDYYGHIAISVDSIDGFIDTKRKLLSELGGAITLEPKIMAGTTTKLAFIADPDGYKIELLERHS